MNELRAWPLDQKEYTSVDLGAAYAARSRGILFGTDFTVEAINGLSITLGKGLACLHHDEYWAMFPYAKDAQTLTFTNADGSLPRYDVITLLYDKNLNTAGLDVRVGAIAATPTLPAIRRDDDFDEIFLYSIYRGTGTTGITAADITDLRLNADYCGLMGSELDQVDTSVMQAQFDTLLATIEDELADINSDSFLTTSQFTTFQNTLGNSAYKTIPSSGYLIGTTAATLQSKTPAQVRTDIGALSETTYKAHNTYSTVEHWTGGYWIDGRKIYEKTLVCNITKIGVSEFSWGINNFSNVVGYELIGKQNNGNFRAIPLLSTNPAWFIIIDFLYYSGKLMLQTQQAILTPTVYATLRYTCTDR